MPGKRPGSMPAKLARSRRALELLASCRDGCAEAIMLAHGFSIRALVELVGAGQANEQGNVERKRTRSSGAPT
jgi:hypothetical protein